MNLKGVPVYPPPPGPWIDQPPGSKHCAYILSPLMM